MEQGLLQDLLPSMSYTISDTGCLALNISTSIVHSAGGLPVLAFVRGRGFATSSSSFTKYNFARLTSMSFDLGEFVVPVSIKCVHRKASTECSTP